MTQQELADRARVDTKTVGSLETRGRWPIARSRAGIERALDWPPGEMERIASEEPAPQSLVPRSLLREITENEDLTPAEKDAVLAAVEATLRGGRAAGPAGPYAGAGERRRPAS